MILCLLHKFSNATLVFVGQHIFWPVLFPVSNDTRRDIDGKYAKKFSILCEVGGYYKGIKVFFDL